MTASTLSRRFTAEIIPKRKEVHQTCSFNFRTKFKIYLNRYGEKTLLSDTTDSQSIHITSHSCRKLS